LTIHGSGLNLSDGHEAVPTHPILEKQMKKFALNVDDLAVESFHTHTSAEPRGTVRGNDFTDPQTQQVVAVGTLGCTVQPGTELGTDTCDRRCEPSIATCTGDQLIVA
jgi:hypothetical protein